MRAIEVAFILIFALAITVLTLFAPAPLPPRKPPVALTLANVFMMDFGETRYHVFCQPDGIYRANWYSGTGNTNWKGTWRIERVDGVWHWCVAEQVSTRDGEPTYRWSVPLAEALADGAKVAAGARVKIDLIRGKPDI